VKSYFDIRPPGGGIAWIAGCFIFASLWFIATGGDSPAMQRYAAAFLPVGIGLWLKHSWARWITFAFFSVVAVLYIVMVFDKGLTVRHAVKGLILAGSLFALWDWDVYPETSRQEDETR